MTNQVNQDAEESATIEKTASEETGSENVTAATTQAETSASEQAPAGESEAAAEQSGSAADAETAPQAAATPQAEAAPQVAGQAPPAEPAPQANAPQSAAASASPVSSAPSQSSGNTESADIDFGAILEQFEQEQTVFHPGEMVTGTVLGISDRGVLVDFGFKSEGFVPIEEFIGPDGNVITAVGESVEVVVRNLHSADGGPLLSRTEALGRKVWDDLEAAYQSGAAVTGHVTDKTKGGLKVDIGGIEAFLPGSQIDSRPIRGLDTYIGHDVEARIIKFSRRRNNIVLSRKVITDEVVNAQKAETLDKLAVGYVVEGTIKNLTEYGAFVDIGGIDGLLHVTDMSWGRIHHPGDQFKVGEHIQVKVLKLDREKEKVSLGYKQLLPDPWSTVVEVYPVNTKVKGTVSSVTDYGVFVELEAGVEGLVHVSEISWARRAQSPKRIFHKGQEVDVQVLGVDTDEKRISLGMKQFQDNPWDTVDVKYPIGSKVHGRVRNLTDFGAFVELEEGIDGLVHVSDITWAKKIKHPKDVLKRDQEVDAIVTSIDKRGQRLSLSMKDLTPSAWETFIATHRPGDVVRGKVSRFTNFGVFVELGEGLEGLCHISELSDERVDRPESVASLGQEMDFKILRIEPADQKIGLSHRAVGKDDEPVVDTRMYSSEAKSGMASLGELANLRSGGGEATPKKDPETRRREKQAEKERRAEAYAAREAARVEAEQKAEEEPVGEPTAAAPDEAETAENIPAAEATSDSAPESTSEPAAPEVDDSNEADNASGAPDSSGQPNEKDVTSDTATSEAEPHTPGKPAADAEIGDSAPSPDNEVAEDGQPVSDDTISDVPIADEPAAESATDEGSPAISDATTPRESEASSGPDVDASPAEPTADIDHPDPVNAAADKTSA